MLNEHQSENTPQKHWVEYVTIKDMQEDVGPPPSGFAAQFKTLQDWLFAVCSSDKPRKTITKFKFELFESANDYTIVLVGVNTYEGKIGSETRVEFEPKYMYFKLPQTYYEHLTRQQLVDKLTAELRDFSNTEKFRTSFFAKASIVVFETNGQAIWKR